MPSVQAILECLSWVTSAGFLVLYLRLRHQKLHRVYRVFAAYVLFRVVRLAVLATLPRLWYWVHHQPYFPYANNAYGWIWALSEPALWILQILVVLELYSLVFQNHKGIASLGRWTVIAGLSIAVVLSSITLPSELSHSAEKYVILRWYSLAERGVDASLVAFLLFITAFLAWFPIPLNRNVVLYSMVYAIYFIVGTLSEPGYLERREPGGQGLGSVVPWALDRVPEPRGGSDNGRFPSNLDGAARRATDGATGGHQRQPDAFSARVTDPPRSASGRAWCSR